MIFTLHSFAYDVCKTYFSAFYIAPLHQSQRSEGNEIVSRGVPPSVVKNAIKHGTKISGNTTNEIVHTFENVKVVTDQTSERVITVIKTGQ